jgi:hypothetical protein
MASCVCGSVSGVGYGTSMRSRQARASPTDSSLDVEPDQSARSPLAMAVADTNKGGGFKHTCRTAAVCQHVEAEAEGRGGGLHRTAHNTTHITAYRTKPHHTSTHARTHARTQPHTCACKMLSPVAEPMTSSKTLSQHCCKCITHSFWWSARARSCTSSAATAARRSSRSLMHA